MVISQPTNIPAMNATIGTSLVQWKNPNHSPNPWMTPIGNINAPAIRNPICPF
jgi:hypothetical protein